ncbi:CotY/CotZ family spore coat protein [Niallia sp. XMNu-256]|uniref:CotY/CotZ family spore coat protein n=1 Tax=Niallia sp. XMNu-256 TaxID=3082444 RepID=UPI0030D38D47
MGCGKKDKDAFSHDNCICDVVRAIKDIQDNAVEEDCECPKSCFREPLGTLGATQPENNRKNTRVIVLQTADGSPFHAFFKSKNDPGFGFCTSIFFRVEEVFDNCCATLRVLRPIEGTGTASCDSNDMVEDCCINLQEICEMEIRRFAATEDCVTVDLSCFCAVQCLKDVFIPNVC